MSTEIVGSEETSDANKISNNEAFKLKYGYSKTMFNLMRKYLCSTPEDYRRVRRMNRKKKRTLAYHPLKKVK